MPSTERTHVVLPEGVIREIDKIVGSRGRSAFLTEVARREIKRRRLLELLRREQPIWKDEDHPELQNGAAQWVRDLRGENETRLRATQKRRKRA